jgi:hypothetical protein
VTVHRIDDPTEDLTSPRAHDVIDLRDDALARQVRPVSGRPADLQPGHRLVTITGGDRWMQAEAFVYDIYRKIGYCEESPRNRVEELARWNEQSRFHAVIDDDDEIIGVIRAIFGPYNELPVGQFTRFDDRDPDPVCELSSLTVRTDMRSTGVIEHLYRAGWLDALVTGSRAVVALIDQWLFDVFHATYCLPFRVIGVSEKYMGSEPMPVGMPLGGEHYRSTAERNPEFWAWTLEALTSTDAERWSMPVLADRWPAHGTEHPLVPPPTPALEARVRR